MAAIEDPSEDGVAEVCVAGARALLTGQDRLQGPTKFVIRWRAAIDPAAELTFACRGVVPA